VTAEVVAPIQLYRPGAGRTLARSMGYLHPHWRLVIGSYLALLANTGITLAIPMLIRTIIDDGIAIGDVAAIMTRILALVGLALVRGVLVFLSGRWTEVASQNVAYDLRNDLHDKLQSFSFSYHDRARTGQLLARAISDVDRVRFVTGRAVLRLIEVVTLTVGIAAAMMAMNLGLALLVLTIVPILTLAALEFGRRYRPLSLVIQQQIAEITARLEQNLRGARIIKAFAQEDAEIGRFGEENRRLFRYNMAAARMRAFLLPLLVLIAGAGTLLSLLYGGRLVILGALTIGELVAFTTYASQLQVPIRRLGIVTSGVAQAIAASERVFEILDTRSEVEELPGAQPLGPVRGHVRFEQVSFAYFGLHQVLQEIDFEAQPGEVVALLGTTGSGKSTVINLIPRFYDPTQGRILIDDRDIRNVTVSSLRQQIGIVFQDTRLFATTIRENIAFGRPDASESEIVAAALAAAAHEFILELPQQYDTLVGERGMTLSGGQKQRVAIARALLKDPSILILDDATSSVDVETEAQVQAALSRLMKGRTSFVIAQRLSTIRQADQVLVLDRGRIAAWGRRTAEHTAHDQLLRTSGLYAQIYERQLRPQVQEARIKRDPRWD
jgi:ABC-type multidrug transport system fused ATPase/permease subunit